MTTDPIRRALRVAMACIAVAIPAIPALAAAFHVPAGRVTQITAVFSFVLVLFTGARNHLEDTTAFPAVLKAPPSPGENPVPEPPKPAVAKTVKKRARSSKGQIDLGTAIVIAVLLILVFAVVFGVPNR